MSPVDHSRRAQQHLNDNVCLSEGWRDYRPVLTAVDLESWCIEEALREDRFKLLLVERMRRFINFGSHNGVTPSGKLSGEGFWDEDSTCESSNSHATFAAVTQCKFSRITHDSHGINDNGVVNVHGFACPLIYKQVLRVSALYTCWTLAG
jgi:hypothetical protein